MFLRRPCFSMCPRRKRRIFCLSQMLCGKKKLPHFPPRNYFFCTNPPSVGCLAHSPWFCFILEVFCIFFRNPKMKNAESNRRFSFLFLSVLWSNFGFLPRKLDGWKATFPCCILSHMFCFAISRSHLDLVLGIHHTSWRQGGARKQMAIFTSKLDWVGQPVTKLGVSQSVILPQSRRFAWNKKTVEISKHCAEHGVFVSWPFSPFEIFSNWGAAVCRFTLSEWMMLQTPFFPVEIILLRLRG